VASGNIKVATNGKRSTGHMVGTRERLWAAKLICVVVSIIAVVGLHNVAKQPSAASAAGSPQELIQVAQLFNSREKEFLERMHSLSERLERIKAEVLKEIGEEKYWRMLEIMDDLIDEDDCENHRTIRSQILKDM